MTHPLTLLAVGLACLVAAYGCHRAARWVRSITRKTHEN